ncbi:MAG: hydrogenase iron-sulfur subunit [Deltaproteobacteria bacterium]|nr:hydrogenase iron-sulfur subunit [Deltaproteobacteria bacterium]
MNQKVAEPKVAVNINDDQCSRCSICGSLCPYDAITTDHENKKIILDIEKCQVCGICYSACPAKAIDTIYYSCSSVLKYLEKVRPQYKSDTLVIMCKGSAPDFSEVGRLFGVKDFIPLSVPCVGRISEEVLLGVLVAGVKKINILACDEDYCRFHRGSPLTGRRTIALNRMLEQLGYGEEAITLKRNSLKVTVDKDLCIACGNCVYYCPYDAPTLTSAGGISFDLDACRGCGLCVALCPAFALDLENWERARISDLIPHLLAEMKPPKILVFRCQWAVYPPLNGDMSPNIGTIDLPCAGRVEALHVLEALQNGADGVMVVACSEDDCKQEKVSARAEHVVTRIKEKLDQIGLGERINFSAVSPRYQGQVEEAVRQFRQSLEGAGAEKGAAK